MDPAVILLSLAAVLAGSLVKSISGVGLPLIAIPVISMLVDIETAVAVTALPNLALNLALVYRERAHAAESRDLGVLGITNVVGAVLGTVALVSFPEEPLVAGLILVVVVYALRYFTNPAFHLERARARRLAPGVGLVAGVMQGAVGISGPVVASWIHSYRLSRGAQVYSVTTLFAISGGTQFPMLVANGSMSGLWWLSVASCVPALATIPFGARMREAFSSDGFDRFVVIVVLVSALALGVRTFA
ncbi:MAG: sulfite exporter TauE/SafE family protein [Planctomycetota bacterium]